MVDRVVSKRRRIMRDFLIKEVSAVDYPAQGHARAVLMKRADDVEKTNPNHDELGRFSSGSGGGGEGTGGSGRTDAYRVVDISRTKAALQEAGVSTSHIGTNRSLVVQRKMLNELAQEHGIKVHYNKSYDDYPQVSSLQAVAQDIEAMDFEEVLAADQSREAAQQVKDCVWSKWNALQRSFDTIAGDDDVGPADKVTAMQDSLTQFLAAVRAESRTIADTIQKSISAVPALAELLPTTGSEGGSPMTDAEKRQLEELQKSVADLTTKLEAATAKEPAKKAADLAGELEKSQAQLAEVTKKLEQADAEKADALAKAGFPFDDEKDDDEKDDDEKDEKKKAKKVAKGADPVVYKSESTGEEFHKSDDPRLVKLAKAADEGHRIAKEEREKRETSELSKRADDELSAFSEDIAKRDDKIEVLRAIDKMEAGPQVALLKMLEVGGKAISAAFETIGHKRGDVAKSAADFEKCVSEIMSRDKITKLAALDKAAREFPAEFEAYQAGGARLSN